MTGLGAPRAVVIGAAGAIGGAIGHRLATAGYEVVGADRIGFDVRPEWAAQWHQVDVVREDSLEALLGAASPLGAYEAVVYSAGTNYTGPVETTDWDAYDRVMDVNLKGAYRTGQVLARSLRAAPRAMGVVFLASTAGLAGEAGGSVYCGSKFGLRGFVESFAAEIAVLGGRANIVAPGNVDSPMLSDLAASIGAREGRTEHDVLADMATECAFDRLISPEEVAEACTFLAGRSASGISGQTLVVNGPAS